MRLKDADELKEWVENWFTKNKYYHPYSKSNDIPKNELYDILEQMPTIDAVEVVRCKDCKYRLHIGPTEHYPETYVCRIDNISGTRNANDPEWYCADGERRTDENNN